MKNRFFDHFSSTAILVIAGFTLSAGIMAAGQETGRTDLSIGQAANLMQLPLACVETEYPNKLSQTLRSDEDLASPMKLHTAFNGCFNWH